MESPENSASTQFSIFRSTNLKSTHTCQETIFITNFLPVPHEFTVPHQQDKCPSEGKGQ